MRRVRDLRVGDFARLQCGCIVEVDRDDGTFKQFRYRAICDHCKHFLRSGMTGEVSRYYGIDCEPLDEFEQLLMRSFR